VLPSLQATYSPSRFTGDSLGGAWCRHPSSEKTQSARGPLSSHGECHHKIPNLVFCVDEYGRCQASKATNFTALVRIGSAWLCQSLAMIRRLAQITALAQDLHQERAKRTLTCSWVWMQLCQNRYLKRGTRRQRLTIHLVNTLTKTSNCLERELGPKRDVFGM